KDDVDRLVELCLSNSIKTITLSFKQDEDDEIASGMVFYQSAIAPVAPGYEREDLMRYMIFKAKKAGLSVQAWVPQFHDQIAAKRDPAWEMSILKEGRVIPFSKFSKSYFVNPIDPQVQKYQLSIIEEIVSNYDVDAVVLDWLRFDDYNMDLGEVSREIFRKRYGYDPIEIDFSKDSKRRREWNDFRKSVIGEYVKVVKESIERLNPKMELGIFILSPYWSEVAQDPAKFHRYVDFLSPMSYYDDWGYPIDWIYSKESSKNTI
ncbi:MAG: family 10 glycosylhydrolase, partial [Campylobacteraceae bacterium]|nr:family 10 glycosylhydrolase [Campylobacteraceae bacterium]